MERHDHFLFIQEILEKKGLLVKKLALEDRLIEDLKLESIGLLTLTVEIENHYQIILEDQGNVPEKIKDVIDLIESALAKKGT